MIGYRLIEGMKKKGMNGGVD